MRVIKLLDGIYPQSYLIVADKDIEHGPYCERPNGYGGTIGCYDAGCYSPDNDVSGYKDGDEEVHVQCTYIDCWDGHNWKTFLLEIDDVNPEDLDGTLLDKDDPTSAQILKEFESVNWYGPYKNGYRTKESENYIFTQSIWEGSFELATVEER